MVKMFLLAKRGRGGKGECLSPRKSGMHFCRHIKPCSQLQLQIIVGTKQNTFGSIVKGILKFSLSLGEEAAAAQAVARTAQAEAAKAINERDLAEKQLIEMRARLSAVERAQDRLDTVTVSIYYILIIEFS
jgi:hypothetical protein